MAARRIGDAAMAVAAALAGVAVAPLLGHTTAQATPPAARASLLGVSVPSVAIPVPSVAIPVPSLTMSVPSPTVSVPSTTVWLPGTAVSLPGGTVSSPEATASSPAESVPVPVASPLPATPTPGVGGAAGPPSPSDPRRRGGIAPGEAVTPPAGGSVAARTSGLEAERTAGRHSTRSPSRAHRSRSGTIAGGAPSGAVAAAAARPASVRPAAASGSPVVAAARSSGNPLDAIGKHIPLPLPVPDWSKPIILALLLLALLLGVRSRSSAARARRLEAQRTILLEDVEVMQRTLVPEVPARLGGLAASVAYRPADGPAAGGDFYDIFAPGPGRVAIIMGDVAGHGRHALKRAALTRYTVRAYLQAGLEPRAALALAGRALADPSAESFATVAVGLYDTQEGTLVYATAGHPAPILSGVAAHEPIEVCCSPPVGWDVPTGRRQTTVSLPAGAAVCFFSDGLAEARCGEGLLGRKRLAEMIADLGPRPGAAQLIERVTATADSTPDDMAACILVPDIDCLRHVYVEELEVDGQALSGTDVRRFLHACGVPAAKTVEVMASAARIASRLGTAVVRVERGPGRATATAVGDTRADGAPPAEQPRALTAI